MDYQRFFDAVKESIDILAGRAKKSELKRALLVEDLEKLGIDPEKFLSSTKQNPYPLP
jgi:hypothetical protein